MNTKEEITEYARGALINTSKTGKHTGQACFRHFMDIDRDDIYYDETAASNAVKYIETLKHFKGELAGESFKLEPWQKFFICSVFGWKNTETGLRRFKYVYLETGRKNGKSMLLNAISLYVKHAGGCTFHALHKMDYLSLIEKELQGMSGIPTRESGGSCRSSNGWIKKPVDLIAGDESHAWEGYEFPKSLNKLLEKSVEPLFIQVNSASISGKNSYYRLERKRLEKILNYESKDDNNFILFYSADEGDEEFSELSFAKANPNFGISLHDATLERLHENAQQSDLMLRYFKSKRLGIWPPLNEDREHAGSRTAL